MAVNPPQSVIDALLAPTARVDARIEIYEADGITRWSGDTVPRLIDGSVSIDYTRDERRTLDLTLDNSDGGLENAPGQFWYDKIIKVYKSVEINPASVIPPFVLISGDSDSADRLRDQLLTLGLTNTSSANIDDLTADVVSDADVVVIIGGHDGLDAVVTPDQKTMLTQAFMQGAHIFVIGLRAGSVGAAPNALVSGGSWPIGQPGNPFSDSKMTFTPNPAAPGGLGTGWQEFSIPLTENFYYVDDPIAAIQLTQRLVFPWGGGDTIGFGTTLGWTADSNPFWSALNTANPDSRWALMIAQLNYNDANCMELVTKVIHWLANTDASSVSSWELQIGEFMIDNIAEDNSPRQSKITGRDYTKKCITSEFNQAVEFDGPIVLENIVSDLAANAGITKMVLPSSGVVIDGSYTYERGSSRWAAMKALANAYSYDVYFDGQGYLQLTPYQDPTTTPPVYTFLTGSTVGNMVSYTKTTDDSQLFNHILVVGATDDTTGLTTWAEAIDTDSDSPASVAAIGDRGYEYDNDFITDSDQAQAVANSLLSSYTLEQFTLDFSAISMFFLDVGQIIRWIDPRPSAGDPNTFLLQTMNIPIVYGPMDATAVRLLSVM